MLCVCNLANALRAGGEVWCREARVRFPYATVLGYYRPRTGVEVNPADKDVLEAEDWIIGISADKKAFVPAGERERFFLLDSSAFVLKNAPKVRPHCTAKTCACSRQSFHPLTQWQTLFGRPSL
jgi:hypothetical protein